MSRLRLSLDVACPRCHATWPRRSARFCGRCGEPLATSTQLAASAPLATSARSRSRSRRLPDATIIAAMGAAVLVLASVVGAVIVAGSDTEETRTGDPDTIALPEPEELRPPDEPSSDESPTEEGARSPDSTLDETHPAGRSAIDPVVRDLPRVTCLPEGCDRWFTPLPAGQVLDVGSVLLHVERKVGPPTDWPDEGREEPSRDYAVLTAVDPAAGEVVWTNELRLPHLTDRAVQALPAGDLLVLAWERKVMAIDPHTGERRWTNHLDPGVHLVHPGPSEDVLVWWAQESSDDEVVRADDLGGGTAATVPGLLVSLDLDTGELRWRREARPVLVTDTHLVSARPGGMLQGIDLRDSTLTWSRTLPTQLERQPVPLADDRALVRTDQHLEVLDLATGESVARQGANTVLPVTAAGSTAIVHSLELRPSRERPRAEPSTVRVHHLDDPDGAPMQVEGVIAVQPLWDRSHALAGSWRRAPADGVAIVVQPDTEVDVLLVGPSGEVTSDGGVRLGSQRCCWRLLAGSDASGLTFLDPDAVGDRVVTLSAADLAPLASIELERGMVITDVVHNDPPLVIAHGGDGVGRGMWLASAEGLAGILGPSELVRATPDPVVMTADGLLALDLG